MYTRTEAFLLCAPPLPPLPSAREAHVRRLAYVPDDVFVDYETALCACRIREAGPAHIRKAGPVNCLSRRRCALHDRASAPPVSRLCIAGCRYDRFVLCSAAAAPACLTTLEHFVSGAASDAASWRRVHSIA